MPSADRPSRYRLGGDRFGRDYFVWWWLREGGSEQGLRRAVVQHVHALYWRAAIRRRYTFVTTYCSAKGLEYKHTSAVLRGDLAMHLEHVAQAIEHFQGAALPVRGRMAAYVELAVRRALQAKRPARRGARRPRPRSDGLLGLQVAPGEGVGGVGRAMSDPAVSELQTVALPALRRSVAALMGRAEGELDLADVTVEPVERPELDGAEWPDQDGDVDGFPAGDSAVLTVWLGNRWTTETTLSGLVEVRGHFILRVEEWDLSQSWGSAVTRGGRRPRRVRALRLLPEVIGATPDEHGDYEFASSPARVDWYDGRPHFYWDVDDEAAAARAWGEESGSPRYVVPTAHE